MVEMSSIPEQAVVLPTHPRDAIFILLTPSNDLQHYSLNPSPPIHPKLSRYELL